MKRRTEITFEVEEVCVARRLRPPPLWCGSCPAGSPLVTPAEAALRTGRTTRALYRLVEAGLIHYVEHPLYELLVCLDTAGAAPAVRDPRRDPARDANP